ncbi:MAG: hypothetical protein RL885_01510 [Planctomycetota bacterium]
MNWIVCVWLLAALPQEPKSPAEALLDKMEDAQVGDTDLSEIRSWRYSGIVEFAGMAGLEGRIFEVYERPLKAYSRIELPTGTMEDGTDGEVCWEKNELQGVMIHEGSPAALKLRGYRSMMMRPWKESWKGAKLLGEVELDGRPHYKLQLTPHVGDPDTVWVDQETYLPSRTELIVDSAPEPGMRVTVQITYGDWKKIDGIQYYTRRRIKVGAVEMIQRYEKIETNVEIEDGQLALPEQVKQELERSKQKDGNGDG